MKLKHSERRLHTGIATRFRAWYPLPTSETRRPDNLTPPGCEPEADENGVDLSLMKWFKTLTPLERLRYAQAQANKVLKIRRENGIG